jgi:molybdopterin/thiamine biosynthesis adenylyltransferase/ubiquinone/menaquinone biosynthesis C-methylase UbiE
MEAKYEEFFSRNIGILSAEEQNKLSSSCVAIAGVGGVGGIQLVMLARAGIEKFNIADPDLFAITDINRQYGAYQSTINKNKADVMKDIIKDINPHCEVRVFNKGIDKENAEYFVKDAEVVIDAIEYFTTEKKICLHQEARKQGKYVFTSPIAGFGSSLLAFDPKGMTFEEYFCLNEKNKKLSLKKLCPIYPEYLDKSLYEDAADKKRPIPSFSTSTAISGALLATEVILFLLNKKNPVTVPYCTLVDFYRQKFDVIKIEDKKDEWKKFWSDFAADAYDNLQLMQEYKKMHDRISLLVGKNKCILDAGCGTGNLTMRLAKNNKITALDFSKEMLNITKEKTKGLDNVTIKEGDVSSLDFKEDSFDAVVSVNVLFNLDDPIKAIQEARRVLKKNGSLIVSTPLGNVKFNKELLDKAITLSNLTSEEEKRVREALDYNVTLFKKGGMKFTPTETELCEAFENNGFKITAKEKTYFGSNLLINAIKVKE